MLTTGVRLQGRTSEQRELIAELDESDVGALGFAEEVTFKEIPPSILDEAEARSFPVFSVPLETGFREVISVVNHSILSSEFRAIQRLTSIQRYLLEAYEEDDPRLAVIERLAQVLDVSITLIVPGEETGQTSPGYPVEKVETRLREEPRASVALELDDWHLFATPITAADGWLVAASRRRFVNALTKPAMQAAVPLIVGARQIRQAARRHEDAVKTALLEDLVGDAMQGEQAALRTRAQALGIDLERPGRVIVLARDGEPDALAAFAAEHEWPQLRATLPGGEMAIFTQAETEEVRTALRQGLESDPLMLVGVGRATAGPSDVRESFRDGRQAVEQIRRSGGDGPRMLEFDAFDLGTVLVADAREERIKPKLDKTLSQLRENPHLYEALVTYFEFDMDVTAAAENLCLHTNSLRYRLGRIESLLGKSLKNPAVITNLYLAISVDQELKQDRPKPTP